MKKNVIIVLLLFILLLSFYGNENNDNSNDKNEKSDLVVKTKINKALFRMDITHGILNAVSYAGVLINTGMGTALFSLILLNNQDNWSSTDSISILSIAHRSLTFSSYIIYGINSIITFIKMGFKFFYKKEIHLSHFVLSMVTTFFYFLGIVTMGLVYQAYRNPESSLTPYKKELAIFHGASFYAFALSFTINIISLPIGWKYRKAIGKKKKFN